MGRPRKNREEESRTQETRKPLTSQLRMDMSDWQAKNPGLVGRWVNNEKGRVQQFMRQGWQPVMGESTAGVFDIQNYRKDAKQASDAGSVMSIPVGRGQTVDALDAVFMSIDKGTFNEMQDEKNRKRSELDQALKGGADQSSLSKGEGGLETYAANTPDGGLGYSEKAN